MLFLKLLQFLDKLELYTSVTRGSEGLILNELNRKRLVSVFGFKGGGGFLVDGGYIEP